MQLKISDWCLVDYRNCHCCGQILFCYLSIVLHFATISGTKIYLEGINFQLEAIWCLMTKAGCCLDLRWKSALLVFIDIVLYMIRTLENKAYSLHLCVKGTEMGDEDLCCPSHLPK